MKNSLEKVRKQLKGDFIAITILMLAFFSFGGVSLYNVISHSVRSTEHYDIALIEKSDEKYYAICIDGEECDIVDYNDFCNYDEEIIPKFAKTSIISF